MLTGKCKEDFEYWYPYLVPCHISSALANENSINGVKKQSLKEFYELPFAMQYGVYVDFFDYKEIVIDVNRGFTFFSSSVGVRELRKDVRIGKNSVYHCPKFWEKYETRSEARQKAIEKANEIYNENK